ncbi:tetratricopeptide repeat protein [Thalassotalea sp. ND16A]|uniref:tetratricopeptide repeat protein n=1 Tax=Thalassotalea sp. ND16A TaxID=1535422 RepID=UPI00051A7C1D|nr:tetratricopeptide repeat protein [Thalassotalea sp. ND16A]KGJ89252.1 Adenylate cyclase [Thalassotalea sp. ND16A]
MKNIFTQLKQRQVFKVATIYAVSAWPLIQIADLAVPALGLPDSVMTLLLKIFIAGFPVSLIFAWLFNFTAHGIVRADDQDNAADDNAKKVNILTTFAVAGALLIAVLVTLASQLMVDNQVTINETAASPAIIPQPPSINKSAAINNKTSIAILPFVPFSSDPEDEYFADGMVEELLNLLAKIPDLQVAARTSSFTYKGVTSKSIVEIGKELNVDTILEGSIRKNDTSNKIRVTAQLIKVSTGEHLWSETYDREYRDIFQIQDDIARAVVDKMKITLLGNTATSPFVVGTENVDAMVEYGKGQKELSHRTVPAIKKALTHFRQAITEDPNYARAYVGIADSNVLLALYGSMSELQARTAAQAAVNKALSLNENLGEAYASKGLLLTGADNEKAELAFKRAIELNPNYAMAYMWYGTLRREQGEIASAHQLFEQAFELDPRSPVAAYNVAWCYYQAGSEAKAMDLFSQIVGNDPYYPGAYNLVGDILRNRGRLDESVAMYQRALKVDPVNKNAVQGLLLANMDMNNIEASEFWFSYLEQNPSLLSSTETVFMRARFYAAQGALEQAITYLGQVKSSAGNHGMDLYVQGEVAFYQQNYRAAVNAFEALKNAQMRNKNAFYHLVEGQAALHLAFAYKQLQQPDKMAALLTEFTLFLQQSVNKMANNPGYYYNMAAIKALQNEEEDMLAFFQGAIDAGWVQVWNAKIDPIFKPLKNNQQFAQMIAKVDAELAEMRAKLKEESKR